MVTEPTPVRCPIITNPDDGLADPVEFEPLLARLRSAYACGSRARETFPRGTMQPDGRLDLCKQGIGPTMTARLAAAAVDSTVVRHLLLGTNGLGAAGTSAVADALRPGHQIETLYLGCNRIDADGVTPLAERLAADRTVRALWLKRNPLGDEGVRRLCAALADNHTLRTLDLVNVGLTGEGVHALAAMLARRPARLQRLFLGGNGLGADAAYALGVLINDAGIRELYLAGNHLGDEGVAALALHADGLAMTLGLGGNGFSPTGAVALARHLRSWTALDLARPPSQRALGALDNVVGDDGAAAIAAVLPAAQLRRLDLRHTGISGRGARLLIAAIDDHATLAYLGLRGDVPRRLRQRVAASTAGQPALEIHPDIQAIASVYR